MAAIVGDHQFFLVRAIIYARSGPCLRGYDLSGAAYHRDASARSQHALRQAVGASLEFDAAFLGVERDVEGQVELSPKKDGGGAQMWGRVGDILFDRRPAPGCPDDRIVAK